MKKAFYLVIVFLTLLVACGPRPEIIALQTATAATATAASWTKVPTLTSIPANTSTPTITPTPLPITFIYQDDVPASGRALQEEAAYKAYAYYSQYADLGPVTIYTFSDINLYIDQIFPAIQYDVPTYTKSKFVQDWVAGGGGNTAAKDIVVISSDFLAWKDDANVCYKSKNVAHELFHMLQSRLMHHGLFRPALDYGPEWLKEGSAEVFGHKIANGLNDCSYSTQADIWLNNSITANYPLKEVEGGDFSSKMQFWSLAPYAVGDLIAIAPDGEESVIEYYAEIGKGTPWKESFKLAFGLSIDEFYSRFDLSRTQSDLDTSVCVEQSDARVKCLGLKPNKDFVFMLPFTLTTQAEEWIVESECGITGWGMEGSGGIHILQISVTDNTHGNCQVKVTFSADQQVTVDFVVP